MDKEIKITHTFEAPPAAVWRAFTEPDRLMGWWGPKDFTSPSARIDLRVGGKYVFCMQSPEGQKMYSTGVFKAIDPLKKLVWTDSFSDEHGNIVSPSEYGMGDDFPNELLVTIEFEDLGGKTMVTFRQPGWPEGEDADLAKSGVEQMFEKLDSLLNK